MGALDAEAKKYLGKVSLENRMRKEKISGVIEYMKIEGKSDDDIIDRIMKMYNVTKEYILELR